jgi:multidrug resistance efflux pump
VDSPRPPKSKKGRYITIGAIVAVVIAGTAALSTLEPAAPSVDRATLWIDTVRQGLMKREVRAPGTLLPEHVRILSSVTAGRIEQKLQQPGVTVQPNTPLLVLSNPDVQLELLNAERQLTAAEADLLSLRTRLETERLQQQSSVALAEADYQQAVREAEVADALAKKQLASANEIARAKDRVREIGVRRQSEQRRLALIGETVQQQLEMQRKNVERLRAIAQFQRNRVTSMNVVAGEEGVLQSMDLELGQWVVPGQQLARVAQPGKLKAVLRVPETQARDIIVGQRVQVDTRTGDQRTSVIPGRVVRLDPAVQNGAVVVEVALEGELPRGARADLSVDGTIEIERLENVMHVGRPAYGQPESTVGLFRLEPDGSHARRVQVKLGRASVNTIEIAQGLDVGDLVIISDVSQWDAEERLKIK